MVTETPLLHLSAAAKSSIAPPRAALPARRRLRWPTGRVGQVLLALPFPLALLLLWTLAARYQWVAPQILPAPTVVLSTLQDLFASGELSRNALISFWRVFYGFGAGASLGLLLGIGFGLSPTFRDYCYPLFRAIAQVPILGWLPFLILLLGLDEGLKVVLVAKSVMVPVALNTDQGIRNVPPQYLEVARIFRFNRWQWLSKVVLPAALPGIWSGIRYGLTHAWLALVAVELLASSEGLGFLIVYGRQLYQLDVVLAAVIVVGSVGFALDKVLALIETRLLRWRSNAF
ncbi:ABC transporter permease [Silvimonas sp.]|uniref:ABC transporter permease n=1 Tax=Silvimonas sp. TaxID=2650811 RepID=UPI00283FEA99|nr:ABC transporter permease [Silvimonas sp.]MDR3427495.1 ABC transporter permease [Silvimonas sp.]